MRSKILVLAIAVAASAFAPAQWSQSYPAQPNAIIPPSGSGGAAGACTNAANKTSVTISVPDSLRLTNVDVSVHLSHSWAHDLRITLTHGGTSVVLFDQYPTTSGKSFSGLYSFDDQAGSTIAASVNPNLPALVPATYQPQSPLSAFNGLSSAGPWTLELCDLAANDTGVLYDWTIFVGAGNVIHAPFQNAEPIPDGAPGGCVGPVTHVINVPAGGGSIAAVMVGLSLNHSRAADLAITLTHGAVSVALCGPNSPPSALTLNTFYSFDDSASQSWDQGLASSNGWFSLPVGSYRPDSPLSAFEGLDSAGAWFVTVCDAVPGNTGFLSGLELQYAAPGFQFDLSQPAGSSSIVLKDTGGTPGHHYLNAFTLVPGSFPAGWLNGLDISMTDLVTQVTWGVPFFGVLDASGNATVTIPGPIPSSIGIQFASFDLAPNGVPVNSIPARSYTTAP